MQARNLGIVLAENPRIEELGLSLQDSTIPQDAVSDNLDPNKDHNMFCTWICDKFSDDVKQAPLRLRRLHLDKPLDINSRDLARLTHRQVLEQVFQWAGQVDTEWTPFCIKSPDYTVFSYAACPALWEDFPAAVWGRHHRF